jgi:hypothetical protein
MSNYCHHSKKKFHPYWQSVTPYLTLLQSLATMGIYFLPLWLCLFWAFPINGIKVHIFSSFLWVNKILSHL